MSVSDQSVTPVNFRVQVQTFFDGDTAELKLPTMTTKGQYAVAPTSYEGVTTQTTLFADPGTTVYLRAQRDDVSTFGGLEMTITGHLVDP